MDLRQLNHFLAVAEELHFGRAAERLGMTQPPLSQSIMALERELGAPLFTRTKRQVALTPFGRQWLEHVRPAVGAVADLAAVARRLQAGTVGRIVLSFVSSADYSILPALVRRYANAFPRVDMTLVEATSDVQVEALVEGRTDAGLLIPPASGLPAAIDYRPLLREPLVAAVPENWVKDGSLLVEDGRLAGEGWLDQPLLLFPRHVAPTFHDLVIDHYRAQGREPHVRQRAIQMQTIISLVSADMGLALVPASLRNLARTGVRYLPLAGLAPMLETGLAWRRSDEAPTLRALLGIALDMAGG
ncbi:LysR family transcriptional regulator [Sphingobium fuliginis]|uniref:Aromatic hydrocarbon utilization transcriptional regulator CatR n=1 Tax=Sphingobium fuliginis (strain ATCC 27551) TaxID=336203 RepID=A0A292ZP16_SPHSA|nr:LysR family transcriptional regulator [Sphingobium fuliginis]GAY24595.1 aromatic hydrocarbon utilization transcriptional regulator CatR [Sphingobium fuliginis]